MCCWSSVLMVTDHRRGGTHVPPLWGSQFDEVIATLQSAANVLEDVVNPTLFTVSERLASFSIGGEFPVSRLRNDKIVDIEFKEFGNRLDCLPVVLRISKVHSEVRPRINQLDNTTIHRINSKYNPVGRVSGILKNHWIGTLNGVRPLSKSGS